MTRKLVFSLWLVLANTTPALAAFDGDYAPENWTVTKPGPSFPVEVDIEGAFDWFFDGGLGTTTSLFIDSPDCASEEDEGGCTAPGYAMAIEANAVADAFIEFEWTFNTTDGADYDSLGIWRNGVFNLLVDVDGANSQSGAAGFNVLTGDSFGFGLWSEDSCCNPSSSEVYNFTVGTAGQDEYGIGPSPVPLPAAFWLFGSALVGVAGLRARRRQPIAS